MACYYLTRASEGRSDGLGFGGWIRRYGYAIILAKGPVTNGLDMASVQQIRRSRSCMLTFLLIFLACADRSSTGFPGKQCYLLVSSNGNGN